MSVESIVVNVENIANWSGEYGRECENANSRGVFFLIMPLCLFFPAKLKTKEIEAGDANMRVKVKEYLSGILDKVEDKMQISIKRPSKYEKMKKEKQAASQLPCETSVEEIIDNKLHYRSKRNVVRLYLCKIVEDAAEQCQVIDMKLVSLRKRRF